MNFVSLWGLPCGEIQVAAYFLSQFHMHLQAEYHGVRSLSLLKEYLGNRSLQAERFSEAAFAVVVFSLSIVIGHVEGCRHISFAERN